MTDNLMTQVEFAARRGVGKSAVSNWKKAGLLVFGEDPARSGKLLVNVQMTEARLATSVDPTRGRPTTGAAAPALPLGSAPAPASDAQRLAEVRGDLVEEQRTRLRLQNAKEAGELVALAEASRRVSEMGRLARERMHAMVRTFGERLAAERDPRAVVSLLGDEIDRAFAQLADQAEAGALSGDDDDIDDVELPKPAAELAEVA